MLNICGAYMLSEYRKSGIYTKLSAYLLETLAVEGYKRCGVDYMSFTAPCGINCGTCYAYLRQKNRCNGCLEEKIKKSVNRDGCKIKLCEEHKKTGCAYCFKCSEFPCEMLKHIDKRYSKKYHLSLIENQLSIQKIGISEFIKKEDEKWKCDGCGKVLCVHKEECLVCKKNRFSI